MNWSKDMEGKVFLQDVYLQLICKKVCDSLEWKFLKDILVGMQIPQKFLGWVVSCKRTISYSIMINGGLSPAFQAK